MVLQQSTATTTKASSSISVKVLPNIRNIVSTVTQSHLYVGQTESISVLVEPIIVLILHMNGNQVISQWQLWIN